MKYYIILNNIILKRDIFKIQYYFTMLIIYEYNRYAFV